MQKHVKRLSLGALAGADWREPKKKKDPPLGALEGIARRWAKRGPSFCALGGVALGVPKKRSPPLGALEGVVWRKPNKKDLPLGAL